MSAVLTKAGQKLFAQHIEQYAPQDPLYEFYNDSSGKKKRRRRQIPPGLSARDVKILKSVQTRAHYLDKGFKFGPVRFGWTFIIGLIPGVGDIADALLNYLFVVRKARQADIPPWLLSQMLLNNAVSALAGLIPFLGDVVLAAFKANSRNAALLEEFLRIRGEELLRAQHSLAGTSAGTSAVGGGSGGLGKLRSTATAMAVAAGVSKHDAIQVKPGAGLAPGEIVPPAPSGSTSVGTSGQKVSNVPQEAKVGAVSPSASTSAKRSKLGFSGWRGAGNKGKAVDSAGATTRGAGDGRSGTPVGERGRFVEDVSK